MLVRVVCSFLRHLGYPRSRPLALNQLLVFWRCCNNEAWLQRLVRVRDLDGVGAELTCTSHLCGNKVGAHWSLDAHEKCLWFMVSLKEQRSGHYRLSVHLTLCSDSAYLLQEHSGPTLRHRTKVLS